jgi:hypothetical protein
MNIQVCTLQPKAGHILAVLAAAAAIAVPKDNPGLSGYCLPTERVEKGLANLKIPAEMLPLSMQTYEPRHKQAKL